MGQLVKKQANEESNSLILPARGLIHILKLERRLRENDFGRTLGTLSRAHQIAAISVHDSTRQEVTGQMRSCEAGAATAALGHHTPQAARARPGSAGRCFNFVAG